MKVLHVITGLEVGGAETQLAMFLRHTRHQSDVVTLYNPGSVAEQIRADGTRVRDIGMTRNTQLGALLRLRSIIADGRYDVVHTHLYRTQIYARPAARLARTPVVVTTEHSIGETHIEGRKMTAGVRGLYLGSELFSDATIAVSDVVKERLVRWGVPAKKIIMIPNGLETARLAFDPAVRARARKEFGIGPDTYVIGALGRIYEGKRVEMMVEAAAPMLGERCKILVIGTGEYQPQVEAMTAQLGVADHVIFAGSRPHTEVPAMMAAFDLYVASSVQETFGLSVLEAMASGLPVVYTVCPALDGIQTGQARQVAGTPEAMRAEIRKAVEAGPQPREADSAVFGRYGMESVARQIDDLYERILARRGRRARRRQLADTAALHSNNGSGAELAGAGEGGGTVRAVKTSIQAPDQAAGMAWRGGSHQSRAQKIARLLRTFAANPVVVSRALPGEFRQWYRWSHERGRYPELQADEDWGERLHSLLGAAWPCPQRERLDGIMADIGTLLEARGLRMGRGTYAYYSDAESSLCRAAWCAALHTRPEVVIETGVAHGVTSRVVLEALRHNDFGHLWSIDLPFPFDHRLHTETGAAVTDVCRPRWSYVEGSSRQQLPPLVIEFGHVEMFIHDSLHTTRNTLFEMEQAASAMPAGGVMIVDDIDSHEGFTTFARRHPEYQTLVCPSADKIGMFGVAVKSA
jgi:glycosyltransferase involved in cell wall biosynthesis